MELYDKIISIFNYMLLIIVLFYDGYDGFITFIDHHFTKLYNT